MSGSNIVTSILFIFAMVSISQGNSLRLDKKNAGESKEFIGLTFAYSFWCILAIISATVSLEHIVLKYSFYYLAEFSKIVTFVMTIEVMAYLTGYIKERKRTLYIIVVAFMYIGVGLELINLIFGGAKLSQNVHGLSINNEHQILILFHMIYDFGILFVLLLLAVRYYEKCRKEREFYAFRLYIWSVAVMLVGFLLENLSYILLHAYNPSVIFCMIFAIIIFRFSLIYKRGIEYVRDDYSEVLAPTCEESIVVVNDEGLVIYSNKRAQVMAESYRDVFEGRDVCALFSIKDEDRKRLFLSSNNTVHIKGTYKKAEIPVVLTCENRFDRYKNVFASVITINSDTAEADTKNSGGMKYPAQYAPLESSDIEHDDIVNLRLDELISMIEKAIAFFDAKDKTQFLLILKGIKKGAEKEGFSALFELSKRIENELEYSDLLPVESMVIEMDRQKESIKALR